MLTPSVYETVKNSNNCDCYELESGGSTELKIRNKLEHLWHMVGNTPLLEISYRLMTELSVRLF